MTRHAISRHWLMMKVCACLVMPWLICYCAIFYFHLFGPKGGGGQQLPRAANVSAFEPNSNDPTATAEASPASPEWMKPYQQQRFPLAKWASASERNCLLPKPHSCDTTHTHTHTMLPVRQGGGLRNLVIPAVNYVLNGVWCYGKKSQVFIQGRHHS